MESNQKVVVITGASRGIGAELVKGFHGNGYGIVANSRSINSSDVVNDPAVLLVDGDIALPETANRIVSEAVRKLGRIDTLINNVGIFIPRPFTDYSEADFLATAAVNLAGFFYISQKAVAQMLEAGSGHIVNITASIGEHAVASVPTAPPL